jgi:short-subunit dehydrogenase
MEQRRIMITGASSGFGLEIAIEALKRGHTVVGTARNIAKAKSQASQLEAIGMIWLQLDVTASDAYDVVHSAVLKHDIDLLVNNAGYGLYGVFEDMRYVKPSRKLLQHD